MNIMNTNIIPLSERFPAAIGSDDLRTATSPFDLRALNTLAWRARTSRPALRDADGKLAGFADPRLPEDLTSEDFASFLAYTDRASYLAWVAEWKAVYADLSKQIRADKTECRQMQRCGNERASSMQVRLVDEGISARMLLALRHVAKVDSWSRATAARAAAAEARV